MREFACSSLGYNCGWKHRERTEDLLTDVVAIHLREVHGVPELTQEMIGAVKHAFKNGEPVEAPAEEDALVLREVSCKDIGMDCGYRYIAQTKDLIADGIAMHAREAHGITELSPEMVTRIKTLAHEWRG